MTWNEGLLPDQEAAARNIGSHSRLLAGPGTGKTLVITRRILYLIQEQRVDPNQILSLTFTRAATQELRNRVSAELVDCVMPKIYTLHSFALRQLLRNSARLVDLPRPLRIADDWEERNIIHEDLKLVLGFDRIKLVADLFNQLSADWQSLSAESGSFTPEPRFIGAWEEHRSMFGYTLRSELVYQLKRSLEQIGDFELEAPLQHLIIDEYQDLNQCDLAVIQALVRLGLELYVAGDDDQSIYGFRKAHPEGIRRFLEDYPGSANLPIEICMRCDTEILALAEFVARLDPRRIPKGTRSQDGRDPGEVALLRFPTQHEEATEIARLCQNLIQVEGYQPSEILILSRANTRNAISRVIESAFQEQNVPFSCDISARTPFDEPVGRIVLSILRLLRNESDHLAWRSILKVRNNRIGDTTIESLVGLGRHRGVTFTDVLNDIRADHSLIARVGGIVSREYDSVLQLLNELQSEFNMEHIDLESFQSLLNRIYEWLSQNREGFDEINRYLNETLASTEQGSINDLLQAIESTYESIEQEIDPNCVNMLTMHKAKGLSSNAVIILAAEDEFIPGRNEAEPSLGDERRLLFVSLSRARFKLFITYCNERLREQSMLGRSTGESRRTLTRFLRHAPLHPVPGIEFVRERLE